MRQYVFLIIVATLYLSSVFYFMYFATVVSLVSESCSTVLIICCIHDFWCILSLQFIQFLFRNCPYLLIEQKSLFLDTQLKQQMVKSRNLLFLQESYSTDGTKVLSLLLAIKIYMKYFLYLIYSLTLSSVSMLDKGFI
ncbi:hypothetical protein I3842_07G039000 [Carya illinoinensis]|uniref:Transmembrane protein n=1 Tax=Carya illinoinensis TaxID=32201 RepID=A0A922JD12_CARIL|nr:hypothetical protein I3842_07G039000 [Carya illinoinensis]